MLYPNLTIAAFLCISPVTFSASTRKSSILIYTDRIFDTVVSSSSTLVNIHALLAVPTETFTANTLVRTIGVKALSTLYFQIAFMLLQCAFINVLAGTSITFKSFIAETVVTFPSVDTGSPGFVTFVNAKFALVCNHTAFDAIAKITFFALAFI